MKCISLLTHSQLLFRALQWVAFSGNVLL